MLPYILHEKYGKVLPLFYKFAAFVGVAIWFQHLSVAVYKFHDKKWKSVAVFYKFAEFVDLAIWKFLQSQVLPSGSNELFFGIFETKILLNRSREIQDPIVIVRKVCPFRGQRKWNLLGKFLQINANFFCFYDKGKFKCCHI